MDLHPAPFAAGKAEPLKPKTILRTTDSSRNTAKEPQISRQKRAFGTVRNANTMQVKKTVDKPTIKPSNEVPKKQPKSMTTNNLVKNNSSGKPKSSFEKKCTNSPKKVVSVVEPRTPVASHFIIKSEVIGTPYHSAKNCSKCRFDRLETASYWLGQIKLAESVGKHFVSVAFFRLAFDCNAEPMRNLRVELKRYMARHRYLSSQTEWKDVSLAYGILKDESPAEGVSLELEKGAASQTTSSGVDQDQKEVKKQQLEQPETK